MWNRLCPHGPYRDHFTEPMDHFVPLYALAEELGRDDVAGVQVLSGLLAEAEQRKQVTRFVRDVLVRMLFQSLPSGWPAVRDFESRFAVAKALGCWSGYTPETHQERAHQVMQRRPRESTSGGAMLHVCRRSLRNGLGLDGTTRDAAG